MSIQDYSTILTGGTIVSLLAATMFSFGNPTYSQEPSTTEIVKDVPEALPLQSNCNPDPSLFNDCVSLYVAARDFEQKSQPIFFDKEILVNKLERTLGVYLNETLLKEYRIGMGQAGGAEAGDKQYRGDLRTPEGVFYSAQIFPGPHQFHSYAFVSYPSIEDAIRGLESGDITQDSYNKIINAHNRCQKPPRDTILGNDILIHGEGNYQQNTRGKNWTLGCVALMDEEISELTWFMDEGKNSFDLNQQPTTTNLRCATMIYIDSGLETHEEPISYWRNQAQIQDQLLDKL